jgi:hypothetical protein
MWCQSCAQDVPGVPSLEAGEFSCPRCGVVLAPALPHLRTPVRPQPDRPAPPVAAPPATTIEAPDSCPPLYDDWEMDEELRRIERVLKATCPGEFDPPPPHEEKAYRLDAAHGSPPTAPHSPAPKGYTFKPKPVHRPAATPTEGGVLLAATTWGFLSLGTTAFVCGGILLCWSVVAARPELWTIGMPVGLGGQIALLVGLVLQLDRLWQENRKAAAKLHDVDEQLHELKTTTTLLGTTHGPSGTFYAHMAGGASPQLLLTDLKGQLDLLAMKLGREHD